MRTVERESDERSLIEAAQIEPEKFGGLYDQNFSRIYAFFARRVATREEAQDLTSEVFHQALASLKNFRSQGAPFIAWLYGIAAHVLSRHWKTSGRYAREDVADFSGMAEEIERSVLLGQLVDALPTDQRHVIITRFVEQKSIREIAEELGRSEGAIKQLQLRALEKLREKAGEKP